MSEPETVKFVMPLYRKEGMSVESFREYYESHHRLIGEKYLKGYAERYVRRYPNPLAGADPADFDVLLEIWYPDQATYLACMKHLQTPEIAEEIRADEARLFDRTRMRGYLLSEAASDMS